MNLLIVLTLTGVLGGMLGCTLGFVIYIYKITKANNRMLKVLMRKIGMNEAEIAEAAGEQLKVTGI